MNDAFRLLADLTGLGIEVVAHGDRLRYHPQSAMTPDLMRRMKTHKRELLAAFSSGLAASEIETRETESTATCDRWENCIEPPAPCPKCSSLLFWWNLLGDRRCMTCDPPTVAIRAMERAEQIRRRHRIPSPAGTAERLADLRRIIENDS